MRRAQWRLSHRLSRFAFHSCPYALGFALEFLIRAFAGVYVHFDKDLPSHVCGAF
jgi:hypothetical protein